jgi:hypothetical protein
LDEGRALTSDQDLEFAPGAGGALAYYAASTDSGEQPVPDENVNGIGRVVVDCRLFHCLRLSRRGAVLVHATAWS